MSLPIKIVAQNVMDAYYQQYADETAFFTLDDFVHHVGAAAGEIFRQEFQVAYAEQRQDTRGQSMVTLSQGMLVDEVLKVTKKDGYWRAILENDVFTFPFDASDAGIQDVEAVKPANSCQLIRSRASVKWSLDIMPTMNKIFWWRDRDSIMFYSNTNANLTEVRVWYVPAIGENMLIPDAIVHLVERTAIAAMREAQQGVIVKQANDLNSNKIAQTEINLNAAK